MPWTALQIQPSGDFKICCFSSITKENGQSLNHGMAIDENGQVMNILTHSIVDALNSKYHKEIRLAQSKDERHPMCKVCWDRDDANKNNNSTNSLRYYRTFIQLKNVDNAISMEKAEFMMGEDGSISNIPLSLDLRFTNVCNMQCIMCDSKYSNQWFKDELLVNGRDYISYDDKKYKIFEIDGVFKSEMPVWHDSDEWWNQFELIKGQIRHLYITGGEPFIVKSHDILLDKLIDAGLAKNIILEYDTNLTVINDKIINRLKKFKKVVLSVSCDDVEEQFELIRYPGKFNILLENLDKLRQKNLKIRHLSTCVGIYSLYSPIRLNNYFRKMGINDLFDGNQLDFSFRFLKNPVGTNIALLPRHLKLKMIDVYQNSNLPNKWKNYLIGYLENNLDTYSEELCIKSVNDHIIYLDKLDSIRGTNWKKTFPEIVELLKEHL